MIYSYIVHSSFCADRSERTQDTTKHRIIMATQNESYGTIPYNIDNTYYLGETTMTPQQRRKKLLNCLVPLVAAFLIVGGAAAYLLRDFSHLYPTGNGIKPQHGDYNPVVSPAPKVPAVRQSPIGPSSSSSHFPLASCDDNANCADLGLVGLCCPTGAGVKLRCCD